MIRSASPSVFQPEEKRELMGKPSKLKKVLTGSDQPSILFVPHPNHKAEDADLIVVSDPKLYTKVLEGVEQALELGRQGVERIDQKQEKKRIIV